LYHVRLAAVIEEPEKVKEAGGLESADVWGDAADDVSLGS
jgi:hypothetical protein